MKNQAPCLGSTSLKLNLIVFCVHHRLVKLSTENNETGCCVTYFSASLHQFAMLWRVRWHCVSCVSYSVATLKKKFCLDPEWKHAQMHVEEFKKRSASTTLEPETTKGMKTNVSSTWSPQPSECGIPEMIKEAVCCSHVFRTVAELWSLMMINDD